MKFAVLLLTCFFYVNLISLEVNDLDFNSHVYSQVISYNSDLKENYYCSNIANGDFLEFLKLYKNRPIAVNSSGMRSHGNFFLWYLLKNIQPTLVIESGVLRGQSTWTIEQAVPQADIVAIDPELHHISYKSKNARYTTTDFSLLEIPETSGPIVCFFDDHINDFDRVLQAYKKGIKYLIFDDNYGACDTSEIYHLTISNCFEMEQFKEKADILKQIIKHYWIMPQIIGKTSNHPACTKVTTNLPAIWASISEVDSSIREEMRIFAHDSEEYRWITYVELH